ncbi:MAG: phytanoyl-CoA dioxygenase family protein [Algicola sp.]|nr:phytanoyl-CoA dioxygenase family protein [Algicola sp.]
MNTLSQSQIAQFDQQGFLLLPNHLPKVMFETLINDADRLCDAGYKALKTNTASKDYVFTLNYFVSFLNRISNYHLHGGLDSLAILGCPQILSIAQSLCGADFLPSVDMMIVKNKNDDLDLPWHQDLIYASNKYRIIAIGIYLEEAVAGDGALKLVKNSQHQRHDINAMQSTDGQEIIELPVKPGDVLVHNPMLVHWSDRLVNQKQRRTLYYECRPIAQVVDEENWPSEIIQNRLDLMATAQSVYQRLYADQPQFKIQLSEPWSDGKMMSDLKSIYQQPIPFSTVNYGHQKKSR